ncbi:MAG: sodium:proton antiporter [Planctomycetes bacterium]|nr:sodium:proton antiporter [Planctomycetota bacterium]
MPIFAAALDLPVWSIAPFALLLLAIAILPLFAEDWWHKNFNKAIVTLQLVLPTVVFLGYIQFVEQQPAFVALTHEMAEYVSFILLLGSLFVVSGGIVISGDVKATPLTNTCILAVGAVLANFIGTTGASVLLIRPILRINKQRRNTRHIPIFFIFVVSNLGGLLTPLGDPPLFLGYLKNVPFFWTLHLWKEWLFVNGIVLSVFFVWDTLAYRGETTESRLDGNAGKLSLRVKGLLNVPLLAGVIGGVLLQGSLEEPWGKIVGGALMLVMGILSLVLTPRLLRAANEFDWHPIAEVAILFFGIFITMVPALAILSANRDAFAISEPWQYFWLTGALSGFLDNAPTYLTFATMASGSQDFLLLVHDQVPGIHDGPLVLQAISCGAVFMGAMTYIGNGPNFMVKAIAQHAGYETPSFFGYLGYSCAILAPIFILVTIVFFVQLAG